MQQSTGKNHQTVITIQCSPTELTKKRKPQVICNVGALLNSNGGVLVIAFPGQTYQTKDLDQPSRVIEQWIKNLIGTAMMSKKIKFHVAPHQISINVKGSCNLITVDYNMFLPSRTEVNRVLQVENLDTIRDILRGEEWGTWSTELPAVQQIFVKGEEIKLDETYSVQFKQLEDTSTKSTTLADRVVGNKLIEYVSAFANFGGGALYVGVDDKQHIIHGEVVSSNGRESIVRKVTNKINKMIWLGLKNGPRQGKNWDIYFRSVVDKEGRPIESTFVIIIVVARCPGVFSQVPESYHIVNGCVEKMNLETWKEKIFSERSRGKTGADTRPESTSALQMQCQRPIDRLQWSTVGNRKKYDYVNGVLIRMINDGSWEVFWSRLMKEEANCFQGGIKLVILLMKATASYKQGNYEQACRDVEEYRKALNQSEDRLISETREFLLKSSVERCKGNIRESYKHAKDGLVLADQIPAGIVAGEYYANIATVITILLEQETGKERKILREEAISFFKRALEHLERANDYLPSKFDQTQKVHINLAFLHLGCSFASNAIAEGKVEDAAINEAKISLNEVDKCVNEGYPLSEYRNCQHLLARSVLFYRKSQNVNEDEEERRAQLLKSALTFSNEASEKACGSKEMLECTSKHIDFFKKQYAKIITECIPDT
jgi:tetratricopeptide (TPR) repeat protein